MKIIYLFTFISYFTLVLSEIEVYLTISAIIDELIIGSGVPNKLFVRRLIVNWRNVPINNGFNDWIGLFSADPQTNGTEEPYFKKLINFMSNGHQRTSVQLITKNLTDYGDNMPNGCLTDMNGNQWHIAYISNGQVISKNCFKAYPLWMQNNLEIIGNHKLRELVIPGSHNAGCYTQSINPKSNYKYCQADSVYDQLVYGIRYFDIRGGFIACEDDTDTNQLRIVHSIWECGHTLRDVLTQVKTFLDRAPKEVVIFDFHLFQKGFDDKNRTVVKHKHQLLMNLLKEVAGTYIINDTLVNYTINQLVSINKRLVIGYVHKYKGYFSDNDTHLLWENVAHEWANANNVMQLENWFDNNLCLNTNTRLKSAMAELTPTSLGVIFDIYGGLRRMADEVNWRYRYWFIDQWPHCINIVSADFITGSDIVSIAIEANRRKFIGNQNFVNFLA